MKYFVTGVSSGIGKSLSYELVKQGNIVWGVARREKLLKSLNRELNDSPNFIYSTVDLSKELDIKKLFTELKKTNFIPDVVVLNAGIYENDLNQEFSYSIFKKIVTINWLSAMRLVEYFLNVMKPGSQFIAVSSLSAFRGNPNEGVGYSSSKAALSNSFESLYLKYKKRGIAFTTVYFGPIDTPMNRLKNNKRFLSSSDDAAKQILEAIKERKSTYYYPAYMFLLFGLLKLLPNSIMSLVIGLIEKIRS